MAYSKNFPYPEQVHKVKMVQVYKSFPKVLYIRVLKATVLCLLQSVFLRQRTAPWLDWRVLLPVPQPRA